MSDVVKILRAFRPGDVVFIEVDQHLSDEVAKRIKDDFALALKGTEVRVVVLGKGMRVAAREETIDTSNLESAAPAHQ